MAAAAAVRRRYIFKVGMEGEGEVVVWSREGAATVRK